MCKAQPRLSIIVCRWELCDNHHEIWFIYCWTSKPVSPYVPHCLMGTGMKSGVSETGIRTVCWQCTNFNYCHWKGTDSRYQVLAPDDGFKFDALKGIRSGQFTVITAATPLSGCALQPALVRQHFAPMGSTWVITRGAQGTTQDV